MNTTMNINNTLNTTTNNKSTKPSVVKAGSTVSSPRSAFSSPKMAMCPTLFPTLSSSSSSTKLQIKPMPTRPRLVSFEFQKSRLPLMPLVSMDHSNKSPTITDTTRRMALPGIHLSMRPKVLEAALSLKALSRPLNAKPERQAMNWHCYTPAPRNACLSASPPALARQEFPNLACPMTMPSKLLVPDDF